MSSINTRRQKSSISFNGSTWVDGNGNEIFFVDDGNGNYLLPVQSGASVPSAVNNVFGFANAVPTSVTTNLVTYIVPIGKQYALLRVLCSGENIGTYEVFVDGVLQARQRTYFGGDLNTEFDFSALEDFGFRLTAGQQVDVKVTHDRPDAGDFEARIMGSIIG